MANPSVQKREKEKQKKDKAKEKEEKKALRNANKTERVLGPGGEDPDIAGIVPGPQPIPLDDE